MIMLKVIGVCVCTVICVLLLKDKSQVFVSVLTIASICLILYFVFDDLTAIVDTVNDIAKQLDGVIGYVKIMLKVLGVSMVTQLLIDVCQDNGQNSLASAVEIGAKVTIIALILPLFETIITIVNGLVK